MTIAQRSRIQWLDAARGIGIVLVVFGHVLRGLFGARIATDPFWQIVDYTIYTFHMPLFFLLAGVSVTFGPAQSAPAFIKGKLWTIAYPYFLWSLIQGGIMALMSGFTNSSYNAADLLSIGWTPIAQFWFLYVLMICHLTMPALTRYDQALPFVVLGGLIASTFLDTNGMPQRIAHALSFYAAGVWLAARIKNLPPARNWLVILAALGVFAICVSVALNLARMDANHIGAAPAAIAGVIATLLIARTLNGRAAAICATLGGASMTIYILHILFGAGARIALTKLHAPNDVWLHLVVGVTIGVGVPYLIHRFLAARNLLWPFGFAAPPPKKQVRVAHDPAQ